MKNNICRNTIFSLKGALLDGHALVSEGSTSVGPRMQRHSFVDKFGHASLGLTQESTVGFLVLVHLASVIFDLLIFHEVGLASQVRIALSCGDGAAPGLSHSASSLCCLGPDEVTR